jgi:hypothetical protein
VGGSLVPAVGVGKVSGVPVASAVGGTLTSAVGGATLGDTAVGLGRATVAGGSVAGPPGVPEGWPLGLGALEQATTRAVSTRDRANRFKPVITSSFSIAHATLPAHPKT